MTNWDQLDAMGDLARLNQARDLARQQAKRDAQLAAQNAEVVRLLKEQKEREEAEKARLQAMPKCPECLQPVEVGARRCPQCRAEIISWDYHDAAYSWRLICRRKDLSSALTARCEHLNREANENNARLLLCLDGIAAHVERAAKTCEAIRGVVSRYRENDRAVIIHLLRQFYAGKRFATEQEERRIRQAEIALASEYSGDKIAQLAAEAQKEQSSAGPVLGCGCLLTLASAALLAPGVVRFMFGGPVNLPLASILIFSAVGAFCMLFGLGLLSNRGSDTSQKRLVEAQAQRRTLEHKSESLTKSAHDKWVGKFTDNGLLPHVQSLALQSEKVSDAVGEYNNVQQMLDRSVKSFLALETFAEGEGVALGPSLKDFAQRVRDASSIAMPRIEACCGIGPTLGDCCDKWMEMQERIRVACKRAVWILPE